ncbi:MAG: hypothetical protein WCG91_03000 [Candidatus Shapirobacteria bacterium]
MFLVQPIYAQCPVCIVTVGGGMFLAEKLGIDSLLINIWIGGFNAVIGYWLASKFKNRILRNPIILSIILYGFTLFYFYLTKEINFKDSILGIDKILLGETLGLVSVFIGNFLNIYLKKRNGDKVFFPYQKVVFPFSLLIIFTILFKLIFKL